MRLRLPDLPRPVWLVLGLALVYRLVLIFLGGQMFYPDEWRYYQSVELLNRTLHGELRPALKDIFDHAAHCGFVLVGLIPATVQGVLRVGIGLKPEEAWWIPAAFFAVCSTGVLALVYALARRTGADAREAMLALLFAAASTSLARYCRHLFPSDAALLLCLASLWVGLGGRTSLFRSLSAGLLASAGFLVYNGYWPLAGCVLVLHVLAPPFAWAVAVRRAAAAATGLLLPVILMVGISSWAGADFLGALVEHSGSLIGGHIGEAWTIAGLYLWSSEPVLLIVQLVGLVLLVGSISRSDSRARAGLWLGALVFLYGQQVVGAHVLHQWPVFGRLVRMLIPFLCLAAAWGWCRLPERVSPARVALALVAAGGLLVPLRETFPGEWLPGFKRQYTGQLRVMNNNAGPIGEHIEPELLNPDARYVFVNYRILKPIEGLVPVPAGKILWQRRNPSQFPYNFYNGYWPHERVWLRAADFSMRLIDTHSP